MEILLAFIFGAAIGAVAHFALPHRETRGAFVAPVLGALVAGAAWLLLTWLGVTPDNPLLWLAAVVAPLIATVVAVTVLTRVRLAHDRRERTRLRIA